jgi:hypothetical protein
MPFAFMASTSEFLARVLKVKRAASSAVAGRVCEIIVGIMKRKYDRICVREALLLKNILMRSKNSTIRKSDVNNARTRTNNLVNSLVTYRSNIVMN